MCISGFSKLTFHLLRGRVSGENCHFCLRSTTSGPHFDPTILIHCVIWRKEWAKNEVSQANFNTYKRIYNWQPFMKRVYRSPTSVLINSLPLQYLGGLVPEKLGGGVWPASQNPYPTYDQNVGYSIPYLWPDQKFKTLFMTSLLCKNPFSDQHYYTFPSSDQC